MPIEVAVKFLMVEVVLLWLLLFFFIWIAWSGFMTRAIRTSGRTGIALFRILPITGFLFLVFLMLLPMNPLFDINRILIPTAGIMIAVAISAWRVHK